MTRHRPGFSTLFAQIPTVLWNRLVAECEETGDSLARVLERVLSDRYEMTPADLPKRRPPGRRPKRKR